MSAAVMSPNSPLNPAAKEWVPVTTSPVSSTPSKQMPRRNMNTQIRHNPNNRQHAQRGKAHTFPTVMQTPLALKVHASECECARLKRIREKQPAPAFVVVSRDAKSPELHFDPILHARSRREQEQLLAGMIAAEPVARGARISCAACLLDGDWRNGALALVGPRPAVESACIAANMVAPINSRKIQIFPANGESHQYAQVPRCVALEWSALADCASIALASIPQNVSEPSPVSNASGSPRTGTPPLPLPLVECVLPLILLPNTISDDDTNNQVHLSPQTIRVELKHHVLEAAQIFNKESKNACVLVLTYIDSRGVVSLDLPGGKRHLAETAWEVAARELHEETGLILDGVHDDAFHGTSAALHIQEDQSFTTSNYIDGQSVRFFVMAPPSTGDDDEDVKQGEEEAATGGEEDKQIKSSGKKIEKANNDNKSEDEDTTEKEADRVEAKEDESNDDDNKNEVETTTA